ncbi:MAG: bacillithiol biosynthesis cysteine-adding enzyme BshC [Planctomycetota bacterium]
MNVRLAHLPVDILGLAPLARAALAQGPTFAPIPVARKLADIPRPVERHAAGERAVLAGHLRSALDAVFGAALPPRAATSLNLLQQEGTFAVVTGQQPGFLASPLYSLYKALQACRLATELSRAWGAPVVPVFWNHADDHDVAEVHHAWQLNRNNDLQKIALPGMGSGKTPIGELPLSAEAHRLPALHAQLRQVFEEHAHVDWALELCLPRDGETLARALTRSFTELLGAHGLVVVEPAWIRPLLSSELGHIVARGVAAPLALGEAALTSAGLPVAIPSATAALVFRHDAARGRLALRVGGEGFRYDGESGSRTDAELAAEVVQAPEDWSAGALLRPVVQDAVFPTCAYIGGMGELAYHAQLGPLRDASLIPRVPFVPRVSCTLVDDETRFALERCELDVAAALRAKGAFAPEGEASSGPSVIEELRASAAEAAKLVLRHRAGLAELEPALAIGLKKAAEQIQNSVEKVAEKAERVHKNRAGKGERHVRRVNSALGPRGEPQERVLGPFQFLARFGDAFVEALWEELPPFATEHLVVHLDDEPDAAQPDGAPTP